MKNVRCQVYFFYRRTFSLFNFFFIITPFLFSGCQYQFGYGELSEKYSTISIPYVEGDTDGELTSELIKQFSISGALKYVPNDGALRLVVKWLKLHDENVGFRYDRKKGGELKDYIIPTETRLFATVEVSIIDTSTQKVIQGPHIISTSIDFDHEYYSSHHAVNIFSLGQLSDIDAGRETVMHPLNEMLAKKIVDYVIHLW